MTMLELERTRVAWDEVAPGYDRYVTPTHVALSTEALRHAGLRSGQRFLDVAAGSGSLSIPAARLGARVLAVDISPVMVERLQARAREEGLAGVEARVMDGHALELDDDTFDVAGSQFGVMLFPDLARGIREMVRVTRPGGRVVVVAFGPPTQVEFLTFFIGAMKAVATDFRGFPSDPPPLPFQVADPQKLRRELQAAGLGDVRIERTTEEQSFRSGRQMWDWVVNSNPIARGLITELTEDQQPLVQQVLDGMLRERSGGSGPAVLRSLVHIAVGTK